MDRAKRRQRQWELATVLPPILAIIGVVLTNLGEPKGFVFTPWWSAAFTVWLLLLVTVVLHRLVVAQLEPQSQKDQPAGGEPASAEIERVRQFADRVAEEERRKGEEPANNPDVQHAGRRAVDVARNQVAAQVRARRMGLKSLIVGADGRASTSKVQAVLWTYAVLFAFSYMLVLGRVPYDRSGRPRIGLDNAFAAFVGVELQPEYIALLGLPVAAAVAAKALTTGKVAQNQMSKPPGDKSGVAAGVAEIVSNDSGQSDMLDFQYFAFNLLMLAYFFVAFTSMADTPSAGLPDIPPTLLTLAGVSTTSYVVKKALETGVAPSITSVAPLRVRLGRDTTMIIAGSGFLSGRSTDAARRSGAVASSAATELNQVLLDGRPLIARDWTDSTVTVTLPTGRTSDELTGDGWQNRPDAPVVVRDDVGVSSPPVTVEIVLSDPATPAALGPSATVPPAAPAAPAAPAEGSAETAVGNAKPAGGSGQAAGRRQREAARGGRRDGLLDSRASW